jgi:hypothetical protein
MGADSAGGDSVPPVILVKLNARATPSENYYSELPHATAFTA